MANAFNKEERVAFEDILEGFNDALVLSNSVSIYNTDQTMMERTSNTIQRPMPYISRSYSGTDMSSNFGDYTQLSVPATIGFSKSVPWKLSATDQTHPCLLYTSPSPRDRQKSRMPSSA